MQRWQDRTSGKQLAQVAALLSLFALQVLPAERTTPQAGSLNPRRPPGAEAPRSTAETRRAPFRRHHDGNQSRRGSGKRHHGRRGHVSALQRQEDGRDCRLLKRGLKHLDLSELDFKGARSPLGCVWHRPLPRQPLRADLAGARLDRTVLTFANFNGANSKARP